MPASINWKKFSFEADPGSDEEKLLSSEENSEAGSDIILFMLAENEKGYSYFLMLLEDVLNFISDAGAFYANILMLVISPYLRWQMESIIISWRNFCFTMHLVTVVF